MEWVIQRRTFKTWYIHTCVHISLFLTHTHIKTSPSWPSCSSHCSVSKYSQIKPLRWWWKLHYTIFWIGAEMLFMWCTSRWRRFIYRSQKKKTDEQKYNFLKNRLNDWTKTDSRKKHVDDVYIKNGDHFDILIPKCKVCLKGFILSAVASLAHFMFRLHSFFTVSD